MFSSVGYQPVNEPLWLDRRGLLLLQLESLAEHGGSSGMRDEGLRDSALARPRNQLICDPNADIAKLAAAYGFGLAKNHAFVDGNKRIAFIATALFLRLNGWRLATERLDETQTMLNLAGGEITEGQFAAWIRANCEKRKPESIRGKK